MNILVACEFSGRVRDAFRAMGHDAISCDLEPSDSAAGPHYQGDVLTLLDDGWDIQRGDTMFYKISVVKDEITKLQKTIKRLERDMRSRVPGSGYSPVDTEPLRQEALSLMRALDDLLSW